MIQREGDSCTTAIVSSHRAQELAGADKKADLIAFGEWSYNEMMESQPLCRNRSSERREECVRDLADCSPIARLLLAACSVCDQS